MVTIFEVKNFGEDFFFGGGGSGKRCNLLIQREQELLGGLRSGPLDFRWYLPVILIAEYCTPP